MPGLVRAAFFGVHGARRNRNPSAGLLGRVGALASGWGVRDRHTRCHDRDWTLRRLMVSF